MGLSIVISGSIMILTFLITSFIIFNNINNIRSINDAINTKFDNNVITGYLKISSIHSSNDILIITLSNNGTTKFWDFEKFDLIVTYDANISNSNVRVTEYLKYSNTLTNGKWVILYINNDVLDPRILNPHEDAIINAKLTYNIYPHGMVIVNIASNNGVVASRGVII